MAKRARQPSDGAQSDSVEVVEQQPSAAAVDGDIVDGDIVDAPFGAKVRTGTGRSRLAGTPPQPRAHTYVSAVGGGMHLNL